MPKQKHLAKRRINLGPSNLLQAVLLMIITVALLVLVYPFVLQAWYSLTRKPFDQSLLHQASLNKTAHPPQSIDKPGNRLILPSIGIDAEIVDGDNLSILNKHSGVWHETQTSTPDKPGNMVIAGHRFQYRWNSLNYFYNLTEIKPVQNVYIKWQDKLYEYSVVKTLTVDPTQVNILNNDPMITHKLTLYTCTPLGSTAKRFVVIARLNQ